MKILISSLVLTLSLVACGADNDGSNINPDSSANVITACLTSAPAQIMVPAGPVIIGSLGRTYREEFEAREVTLGAFEIDSTEVTNRQFAVFVEATNYVTDAERLQVGFDVPGAAVFKEPTPLSPSWWQFVDGANWRQPEGNNGTFEVMPDHPVVQVSHADAVAYAQWAGRRLPSEAEWEAVAQNGAARRDDPTNANSWQGAFPLQNDVTDGFYMRAPVGCYAPNGLGAYDMIGNVWEWTATPAQTQARSFVIKGGSYLCAENYCRRDRPNSRQFQELDLPTNHIGFRTVRSLR